MVFAPRNRDTRVERALEIAVDSYNQQRKLVAAATGLSAEDQAAADKLTATLDTRLAAAGAVAAGREKNVDNIRKWKLDMTRVITEAVHLANPDDTTEANTIRVGVGLLWRSQSGHAHGTPASRQGLINKDDVISDGNGALWGRATSSTDDVLTALGAATLLTNEAWRVYDLRRQTT